MIGPSTLKQTSPFIAPCQAALFDDTKATTLQLTIELRQTPRCGKAVKPLIDQNIAHQAPGPIENVH